MDIEQLAVSALRPYPKNARTHSRKQIRQIAKSIERFGFCNPVLIDDDNQIIAGHGRVEAASRRMTYGHSWRAPRGLGAISTTQIDEKVAATIRRLPAAALVRGV